VIDVSVDVTEAGDGPIIPLNRWQKDFNVTVACDLSAGAVLTYTLQYTLDKVNRSGVTPVWFESLDLAGASGTGISNIISPAAAVKVSVDSYTSGTLTFRVIQSGA